jgi:N-acetylglucosamine malate deacetylase 2
MNVLAFFAHPDDETMLCGGTLALLSRRGALVHYLSATRGEGGETGEPPLCPQAELGRVREAELRCATQALGSASLTFLNYIDPTIGENNQLFAFTQDEDLLARQIVAVIQRLGAHALLSHGSNGEYGHPAHRLCFRAAWRAIEFLGSQAPLFYTVQSAFPAHPYPKLMNPADPAHIIVDVSSVRSAVTAAALCHRTQNALFTRAASAEAGHPVSVPEVIPAVESLHRVWPTLQFTDLPTDDLADLLAQDSSAA